MSYEKSLPPLSFILLKFAVFCSPSYFSFAHIFLEQITLFATHIMHCRSSVLYCGRRIELITCKKCIDFFVFSYLLFFFLILSLQTISYRRPASLSRPAMFLSIKPFTQRFLTSNLSLTKSSQQRKTARRRNPMKMQKSDEKQYCRSYIA